MPKPKPRGRPSLFRSHPLFKLRRTLGSEHVPLTQQALSDLVGVSVGTLKSQEIGERGATKGLSPEILQKIRLATGAILDPKKQSWVTWGSSVDGPRFVPFTRASFEEHRHMMITASSVLHDDHRKLIHNLIDQMFERSPADRRMQLFMRLTLSLEECSAEFGIDMPIQSFQGLAAREAFTRADADLSRALEIFGPDSVEGQTILKMRAELPKVLS